jgi:hypothetical protein
VIFGEAHLRQVLKAYAAYYNNVQTQRAIGRSNGSASSLPSRFSADFVIIIAGYSLRQAQATLPTPIEKTQDNAADRLRILDDQIELLPLEHGVRSAVTGGRAAAA